FSSSDRGCPLHRRDDSTQYRPRFPVFHTHGAGLVRSDDVADFPVGTALYRNAGHLYERRSLDAPGSVPVRQEDRRPDGEYRHDRVCGDAVAPRLHDIQLADACRPEWKEITATGFGSAAHDISRLFLVHGLRLIGIRQLVDCARQTATRAWLRRRSRHSDRDGLRLRNVSVVLELGGAAKNSGYGEGTEGVVLVA